MHMHIPLFSAHLLIEINCGHPGQLYNGWLENIEAGTGLGASIIFRCHEGMKLDGNTSTVCQIDGRWRYPLPLCLGMNLDHLNVNNLPIVIKILEFIKLLKDFNLFSTLLSEIVSCMRLSYS